MGIFREQSKQRLFVHFPAIWAEKCTENTFAAWAIPNFSWREGENRMQKILIIEDEALIREELKTLLSNAGFAAACVTDFENPLTQVKAQEPDLILLDINLPGQNGYSLCASIRQWADTPILFLTGRATAMDELQALTLGGDDFVTKPYNIPILLARVNALLKRGRPAPAPDMLTYHGVALCLSAGTLCVEGRKVELTKTELKILYDLFQHPEKIVPRLDLVEYLWDNAVHIDDNTLSVNITRIREKMRALGGGVVIQTKRGMGYKLCASPDT